MEIRVTNRSRWWSVYADRIHRNPQEVEQLIVQGIRPQWRTTQIRTAVADEEEAMRRAHLALLAELDAQYGRPSPEDFETASRLIAELSRER